MEQITSFKTIDGMLFLDQQKAALHERELLFKQWCEKVMYRDIEAMDIADKIIEHWDISTLKPKPGMVDPKFLPQNLTP